MEFTQKFYTLKEVADICLITKRIVTLDIKRGIVEAHLRNRRYLCMGKPFKMKTFVVRKEHLSRYFDYRMAILKRKEDVKKFSETRKKWSQNG